MASSLYRLIVKTVEKRVPLKLKPLWNEPSGPKTIFFWAPAFKWGLVIANIADMTRPAEKISLNQSISIGTSSLIYSRWSLVIIPRNLTLFSCCVFTFITSYIQIMRHLY